MTPRARPNIERAYGLSNMQQGILFHCVEETGHLVYISQINLVIEGDMSLDTLERAWRAVINRNDILRSAFVWRKVKTPMQAVYANVPFQIAFHDIRGWCADSQDEWVHRWLEKDRNTELNFAQPPLMRVAVIQRAARVFHIVWTHHHIILDGWSVAQVLAEVFSAYGADPESEQMPRPGALTFEGYLKRIELEQRRERDLRFWSAYLEGYQPQGPIAVERNPRSRRSVAAHEIKGKLDSRASAALSEFGKANRLTLGTCLLGAWAVTISLLSGVRDIVFGVVRSGRPASIEGVERLIGLCSCTLPIRIQVGGNAQITRWLGDVQSMLLDIEEHQHTPLVDIRSAAALPAGYELFDSIVAVENYPVAAAIRLLPRGWNLRSYAGYQTYNYGYGLVAMPFDGLDLLIPYAEDQFSAAFMNQLLETLKSVLVALTESRDLTIHDLLQRCSSHTEPLRAVSPEPVLAMSVPLRDHLARMAREAADDAAVLSGEQCVSWRELHAICTRPDHAEDVFTPCTGDAWTVRNTTAFIRSVCREGEGSRPATLANWGADILEFRQGERLLIAAETISPIACQLLLFALAGGVTIALDELALPEGATHAYWDYLDVEAIARGRLVPQVSSRPVRMISVGQWGELGRYRVDWPDTQRLALLYVRSESDSMVLIETHRRQAGSSSLVQSIVPGETLGIVNAEGMRCRPAVVGQLSLG